MSGIQGSMKIEDFSASEALRNYAGMRAMKGKGIDRTLRNVMKLWVSYAYKSIEKKKGGKPEAIERELKTIVTTYQGVRKAKGKSADEYRGTLAARLFLFFSKDAVAASTLRGAAFYNKVRKFANSRKATAGHHLAGMLPAMRALRAPAGRSKIRHPAGSFSESILEAAAEIMAENYAAGRSPRSVGIGGLVPDAFTSVIPQLEAQLTKFFLDDIKQGAREVGLNPDP